MPKLVNIKQNVMAADEKHAASIRKDMERRGILLLNLIGSPGAGKTTLLEATLKTGRFKASVIEGDLATTRDAQRIQATGAEAIQINTQGGCHLEANLVEKAMSQMDLTGLDILFIENVGNLVCPAEFDLGEDFKVAISSVPEGPDKPLKYPHLFRQAGAVVLTKADIKPYIEFDEELFWTDVTNLNPSAVKIEMATTKGEGVDAWLDLLESWLRDKRSRA